MIVGPSNCGKTTLANALNGCEGPVKKKQDIIYGKNTIDVPGAFIENAWMYKHLIIIAQQASHLLILVDQSRCVNVYPAGFAKAFRCPVTGIISKVDLMKQNEKKCIRQLKDIGIEEPYFKISFNSGIGIKSLKEHLSPYLV